MGRKEHMNVKSETQFWVSNKQMLELMGFSFPDNSPKTVQWTVWALGSKVRNDRLDWSLLSDWKPPITSDYNTGLQTAILKEQHVQPWSSLRIETIYCRTSLFRSQQSPEVPNKEASRCILLPSKRLKSAALISDLLHFLRCCRQQRLSALHPLPGEVDVLAQSVVLQPAAHLLLGPLAEGNTQIAEDRESGRPCQSQSRSRCCCCCEFIKLRGWWNNFNF